MSFKCQFSIDKKHTFLTDCLILVWLDNLKSNYHSLVPRNMFIEVCSMQNMRLYFSCHGWLQNLNLVINSCHFIVKIIHNLCVADTIGEHPTLNLRETWFPSSQGSVTMSVAAKLNFFCSVAR